jgi:hypothetical protein
MADTGHEPTQAPQPIQVSLLIFALDIFFSYL